MSKAPLVQVYTADPSGAATPVLADALNPPLNAPPVQVILTVDCFQLCPPGWPTSPDETGVSPVQWYPHIIRSGRTLTSFACVAAALIAAGAAIEASFELPVQLYTVDPEGAATPVMVTAFDPPFSAPPVKVTLTVDVLQLCPSGWPAPPYQTGVTQIGWSQQTIPSGTTISAFACVAAALIAAGAATPAEG